MFEIIDYKWGFILARNIQIILWLYKFIFLYFGKTHKSLMQIKDMLWYAHQILIKCSSLAQTF